MKVIFKKRFFIILILVSTGWISITSAKSPADSTKFKSHWPSGITRFWVGSNFWANRLQDWRIHNGRLECIESKLPMRTVHLLTRELSDNHGVFTISIKLGKLAPETSDSESWAGLLIGAGRGVLDYRAASLVHYGAGINGGIIVAIDGEGHPVFRDMEEVHYPKLKSRMEGHKISMNSKAVVLELKAEPISNDSYKLILKVKNGDGQTMSFAVLPRVSADRLVGNIALFSHPGSSGTRYWFRDLNVKGSKIKSNPGHAFGPIVGAQYTLSEQTLKLTAQLTPVSLSGNPAAILEIKDPESGNWKEIAKQRIERLGWIAPFKIENWNYAKDLPYRVKFKVPAENGDRTFYWSGTIRGNKIPRDSVKIAAFSCNALTANNPRGMNKNEKRSWGGVDHPHTNWTPDYIMYPHNDLIQNLRKQKVDFYAFLGDQIYEGGSPTQPDRRGGLKSQLDYLYKWYMWYWPVRDLIRDNPSLTIPDDHDVFQGNLWGAAGVKAENINDGGYVMSPEFVNLVQCTQTSHLPDPYDPTPVAQRIGVYYTSYNLGGVSFAILEDRKFKSGPKTPTAKAKLIGRRQMDFLKDWTKDWKHSWMKATLTQTIFGAVHTRGIDGPTAPASDKDTNGWPPARRDSVLRVLRKGFAFMIGGDQHLATVVHHGVDAWNDAGYSFCVPATSNFFPRKWLPSHAGKNRKQGAPDYTGEFIDGFGNRITVLAAANPHDTGREPAALYNKAPGYGIITFYRKTRKIRMDGWPRYADPESAGNNEFKDWPITIDQMDNYGRKSKAWLPEIRVSGVTNPEVEIIREANRERLYTFRMNGNIFKPVVFKTTGSYMVKIGNPDSGQMKTLKNIHPIDIDDQKIIRVKF